MAGKKKKEIVYSGVDSFVSSLKTFQNISINEFKPVEKIPTGSLLLDEMLGGGIPRSKLTEFYGKPSSGKSSIATAIASNIIKNNGRVLWIDLENSFDPNYSKSIGLDINEEKKNFILINGAPTGDDVLEIINRAIHSNEFDLIVLDSVSTLIPTVDYDKEIGEQRIGSVATLLSLSLKKLIASLAISKSALIFINQERAKINVYGSAGTDSTGGNALKFFASLRIYFKQIETINEKDGTIKGIKTQLLVKKSKVSQQGRQAILEFYFENGFKVAQEIFQLALLKGIIKQGGAWYSYGENKWQGAISVIETLEKDEKLFEEIKEKVMSL